MDYTEGKMLEAIDAKLSYLIERLQDAEEKAKGGKPNEAKK